MSVSVPIQLVYDKMRSEGRNIYEVKDGANTIAQNDDTSVEVETAISDLANVIDSLTGQFVYIELSHPNNRGSNGGTKKQILKFRVKLDNYQGNRGNNMDGGQSFQMMMFQMMMQGQAQQTELIRSLTETKGQLQLKEFEHKLELLKKEKDEAQNTDYLDLFAHKVGKILIEAERMEKAVKTGKTGVPIHGTGDEPVNEPKTPNSDKGKRLQAALKKIQTVAGANFLDDLELLANYIEANPAIYQMLMQQVKSQENGQ